MLNDIKKFKLNDYKQALNLIKDYVLKEICNQWQKKRKESLKK